MKVARSDEGSEQQLWGVGSGFDLLLVQAGPTFSRLSTYLNPL